MSEEGRGAIFQPEKFEIFGDFSYDVYAINFVFFAIFAKEIKMCKLEVIAYFGVNDQSHEHICKHPKFIIHTKNYWT